MCRKNLFVYILAVAEENYNGDETKCRRNTGRGPNDAIVHYYCVIFCFFILFHFLATVSVSSSSCFIFFAHRLNILRRQPGNKVKIIVRRGIAYREIKQYFISCSAIAFRYEMLQNKNKIVYQPVINQKKNDFGHSKFDQTTSLDRVTAYIVYLQSSEDL